ncbi:TNF receptor-associated factor 3-like [Stylophora pistillata]|uniref:TNF receptor-associated factor 6 n=1 Tax=Stylophora pistillata TaxID=50429 RepID=A0A2B4SFL7_STYPI|nr:TNF receptor-associated factor 3-like [Stylophora pistillata]PFX28661.1 TNF receptor-associated factor 6 [Stylophora pistillata]
MMAEVPEPCSPFGYKDEFVNPVNEDMQCGICHLPMKEPMITRCGHHFCQECIKEHLQREEPHGFCPVDREAVDQYKDIFPNKDKERKILALAVRCGNEGCQWADELRLKEIHLGDCPFKVIPCPLCKVTMVRRDLDAHSSTQCPWRKLRCDHCQGQYPDCQMEEHHESCDGYPVHCDHEGCTAIASRGMLQDHKDNYCAKTKLPCYFAQLGCQKEVLRENLETHLLSTHKEHIHLLLNEIDLLKRSNLALKEEGKAKIQQIERTLKILMDEKEHARKVQMEEKEQAPKIQMEEKEHARKEDASRQPDKKEKCFKYALIAFFIVVALFVISFCQSRELKRQINEKEQASNGKMDEEVRALNGKIDEKEQALNGKMDEEVQALKIQTSEIREELKRLMDEKEKALKGQMDERENSLISKEQALNEKIDEKIQALTKKIDKLEEALERKIDESKQTLRKELNNSSLISVGVAAVSILISFGLKHISIPFN